MARYIDAEELLKRLPDDLPYKASVKRVLMQAPIADVVPRAKVDEITHYLEQKRINDIEKAAKLMYRETKAEVVSEIFAEIEEMLDMQLKIGCKTRDRAEAEEHPHLYFIASLDGRIYGMRIVEEHIAELKKKYTEGEK